MSLFITACGALILFSALFFAFPRGRAGTAEQNLGQANLEAYRLRQAELAQEGDEDLQADARLRLLEDEQGQAGEVPLAHTGGRFPTWLLLPLVALISVALYYQLGSAADVVIAEQLRSLDENTTPEDMRGMIRAIEERSEQRPENLHYLALLGRYYMGQERYAEAAAVYDELVSKLPEEAAFLAYAAQARFLAADRQLDDGTRLLAEQALAVNPHQRTALGLLGMASYEQGQYRAAIEYWQRLLAMETPGSQSAQMIAGVIASARQQLGEPPESETAVEPAVVSSAGVTVRVSLPAEAQVSAGDTVFVLARNAESDSRMPIAVQRLQADQLPVTLRLDDSNSMAGQKLSETASVLVLVQISPDGRPGEANATWLGQAGPLVPTEDGEALEIVLVPRSS